MNTIDFQAVLSHDPTMARIINDVGELVLTAARIPMFQALARSIIGQQLSRSAATAIHGRFVGLFSEFDCLTPTLICDAETERLTSVGLSRAKAAYVKELARAALDGRLPEMEDVSDLSDSEIIRILTAIKGIGVWSAQMVLMSNLGRPDVLPTTDAGIRRAFGLAYLKGEDATPEQIERYSVRWQPYRSIACKYLWRALDSGLLKGYTLG